MAILNEANRVGVWEKIMRLLSQRREAINLNKNDLRAAVNAADDWVDANAANYNQALPVAARQNLTPKQKAELLVYVITRRFEVS